MSKLGKKLIAAVEEAIEMTRAGKKLPRGKYLGTPLGGVTLSDDIRYMKCDVCGGIIDCADLACVYDHNGPLPHPTEDKPQ